MTATAVLTTDLTHLLDEQRELEEEAVGTGVHRFKKQLEAARKGGRGAHVGSTKFLLGTCMNRMLLVLEADHESRKKTTGPRPLIYAWSQKVGLEEFAYMTSRAILGSLFSKGEEVPTLALAIADLVMDELRYRKFRTVDNEGFRRAMGRMNTSSYSHMSRSLLAIMGKNEIVAATDMSDLVLSPRDRMMLGVQAIDVFMQANPDVIVREAGTDPGRGQSVRKTRVYVRAGVETLAWITRRDNRLADLCPAQLPMVVPPLPWAPKSDGGFRYALKGKWKLIRGGRNRATDEQAPAPMPVVYEALNAIQSTPWKINTRVLEVAETLIRNGGQRAGLPSFEPVPTPKRPKDIETNAAALREWKKLARDAHDENYSRRQHCIGPSRVVTAARRFAEYEAIWFPHTLDFRGRIYPQCEHLSPQGTDFSKGVLQFAEGTPMGSKGGDFLALHLANCIDKLDGVKANTMTRTERIEWVYMNSERIIDVAKNPFDAAWWMDTDCPFMTLAACYEWQAFSGTKFSESYVCALPVAQDGSCNGLQHFSAMFRDEVGAVSVNVAANVRPRDIYRTVAEHVLRGLEDRAIDDQYARLWLNSQLIDRSFAKTPTMTFGYGSKKFGFAEQIRDYVVGHAHWKTGELRTLFRNELGDKSVLGAASTFIADDLWTALGKTVTKAQQAMDWMQSAATGIAKHGKPVSWIVPLTGFPVHQGYYNPKMRQVKTILAGEAYYPAVFEPTNEINGYKQRNAIAPNVVHSLDAAALMLTVSQALTMGVRSFGMVHDSYATTPGEAHRLYTCTREAFFRLYDSGDVANDLEAQFRAQWAEKDLKKFPAKPDMGSFDLTDVLRSEYFFC